MVSSITCDRWKHLHIVAFECHRCWASAKIKDVTCGWRTCTARLDRASVPEARQTEVI